MLYGYLEKSVFPDWPKFPVAISLSVIIGILAIAIVASIVRPPRPSVTSPTSG
jgi:hypothetical protein